MGVYVFKRNALISALAGNEADFGKEVIPKALNKYKVYGYIFNDYWRDIGTIHSFYEVNIELTKPKPSFSFFKPGERIFTRARFLPPSKILSAELHNVLMGEGCILDGSHIEDSVVGLRSVIGEGTVIRRSILMGNDYYSPEKTDRRNRIGIGKNCQIENCILDKNVYIGNDVSITNREKIREKDGDNYYIRDGIVIVPKGTVISDGTKI
jgi:glucose-1-phosphate adenylyltransferase